MPASRKRVFNPYILMTTGVLGGGGAFSINNPASGTTYNQGADGTWTLNLTQPGSTLPLTRIELRYRYADANNYWTVYLERDQTNAQWNMSRAKVVSGTRTVTSLQTNIGSVAAIRVTTSGTSHEWFSSADGSSFTSRGTATDSALQSNTLVGAHYTGGTGSQLIANGDFSAWTADNPDGWTVATEDGSNFITENANGARFVSVSGVGGGNFNISQNVMTAGVEQLLVIDVYSRTTGTFQSGYLPNVNVIAPASVPAGGAQYAARFIPNVVTFYIYRRFESNTDIIFASAFLYLTGALDDGGTTGPSRLYAGS